MSTHRLPAATLAAAAAALTLALAGCGATTNTSSTQQTRTAATGPAQSTTTTTTPATATTVPSVPTRRFVGTITAAHRAQHWFEVRTTANRTVRIHTDAHTGWSGCEWGDMHADLQLDVTARHTAAGWTATTIREHHHAGHPATCHDHHTSTHD